MAEKKEIKKMCISAECGRTRKSVTFPVPAELYDWMNELSKKKAELENKLYAISLQLTKDEIKKTMAYSEYMELNRLTKVIQTEIDRLNIECYVWDKAREICMDIADEEA